MVFDVNSITNGENAINVLGQAPLQPIPWHSPQPA